MESSPSDLGYAPGAKSPSCLRSFEIEAMLDVFILDDSKLLFQVDFKGQDKIEIVLRATKEGVFDDWIASLSKYVRVCGCT